MAASNIPIPSTAAPYVGYGLVQPFARRGGDFRAETGAALIESTLRQIIGTEPDEFPWSSIGVGLRMYKNQNLTADMVAMLQTEVRNALAVWDPRIVVVEVGAVMSEKNRLDVDVKWYLTGLPGSSTEVASEPYTTSVMV